MRQERVATARAIQREHDQLDPNLKASIDWTLETLMRATEEERRLVGNRLGIDYTALSSKGLVAEILFVQRNQKRFAESARALKVEHAMERICKQADRLREILPPGMTLGDYFGSYKCREQDKRKAIRRDEERRRVRRIH